MQALTFIRRGKLIIASALIVLVVLLVYLGLRMRTPRLPPPAASEGEVWGMVIRDPWYDFGTNPDQPETPNRAAQDHMGAMMAQMGVQWVRLEFHIGGGDLAAAEQIARYDYFIREVAPRHDLKVLGLLSYNLIRGQDPRLLGATSAENDPIYSAGIDNPKRIWLNRARLIADYYQDDIAAYQILNEPNRISPVWNEILPASEVARLHTTFYTFFHHIDRAAPGDQAWRDAVPVILGGIQPAGTGDIESFGYLADTYYLRQLYASDAFVQYREKYGRFPLDGLGYHPYPVEIAMSIPPAPEAETQGENEQADNQPDPQRDVDLMVQRLDDVREVLIDVGDPSLPFWLTEIGHNAGFAEQHAESQAEFLRLTYTTLTARDDVARIFWFKYEDFPPATGPNAQQWGTVTIPFAEDEACPGGACYDPLGRPAVLRPSFWAYREMTGADAMLPEPPAEIISRGPLSGTVGEELTFTARVLRPTAAQPITFTWQMTDQDQIVNQGDGEDTVTFTWNNPGVYRLVVEGTNAGGTVIDTRTLRINPPRELQPGLRKE